MSTELVLAPKLRVPIDTLTETLAVLGIRGSGKTNTAVVLAEELLARQQQVVVIDPTDVWWGLKSSKDGNGPGYPVIVLGGRKAELPLGANDGKTIADVVVDHGASLILALRHFESKGDMRRFITDFAERLYYRKGQQDTPSPLMLIIDEASLVVPQNVMGESARMVGAIQQLVRQGRSSGIGVTLIDQRAASVNKDVLTQLEVLVCHRTTSPQDRKALKEWVQQHDEHDRGADFLDSLASLPKGDAWFWAPGLLDLFIRVHVRERKTFDSSRTPKAGETIAAPKVFAPVDLGALRDQLAKTIEENRDNDPKELHRRIQQLERQLAAPVRDGETIVTHATMVSQIDAAVDATRRETEREIQQAIADEGARHERYRKVLCREVELAREALSRVGDTLGAAMDRLDGALKLELEDGGWVKPMPAPPTRPDPAPTYRYPRPSVVETVRTDHRTGRSDRSVTTASGKISGTSQAIVDALAFFAKAGQASVPRAQLAVFCGKTAGGSWSARLSEARSAGLIEDLSDGSVALTPAGAAAADGSTIPKSRRELHARALARLSGKAHRALEILLHIHPDSISRAALAAQCDATPGGSWSARLSEVRAPGFLADLPNGDVKAADILFPRGLR